MASFEQKLQQNAAQIERALEILLTAERLSGPDLPPDRLIAAMRHGTLNGGKRIRPFLLRETARMLGLAPELTIAPAVPDSTDKVKLSLPLAAATPATGMITSDGMGGKIVSRNIRNATPR